MNASCCSRLFRHSVMALALLAPSSAEAQLDLRLVPNAAPVLRTSVRDVPLPDYLLEHTSVRSETRQSVEVVVFAARFSRGKLLGTAESSPFRLDAKASSSSSGMPLGSGISRSQLLGLASLRPMAELEVAQVGTASQTIPVLELLESPGAVFGLPGMNPGIFSEQEHVLVIGVIPADAKQRSRSRAGVMALQGALH